MENNQPKLSKSEQASTEASARSLGNEPQASARSLGQQDSNGSKSVGATPKLSKSEQARLNGAKSKGPVTEAGKQRSAMNALKHATFANVNRSWLPIDAGVLSNESRVLAFRIFEAYCRQLQPQSDAELLLVKQLTGHQCHLDRCLKIEAALMQCHLDQVMPNLIAQASDRETEVANSIGTTHAFLHCINADDKALRSLDRQRRSHERGIKECLRRFKELRKDFPFAIPDQTDPEHFLTVFGVERCTQEEAEAEERATAENPTAEPAAVKDEVEPEEQANIEAEDAEPAEVENVEISSSDDPAEPEENQPLTQASDCDPTGTNLPKAA